MVLKLPSIGKSYRKLKLTIESCKTREQLEVAYQMLKNFKKMYKKVGYPKVIFYELERNIKLKLWK